MTADNNDNINNKTPEAERWESAPSKPKKGGKFKTFALASLVLLSAGVAKIVQTLKAEKQKTGWYDMNKDADSISVNVEEGKFFAIKKEDSKAIKELKDKISKLSEEKNSIINKANKEFTKALKSRDVEGMRNAINAGADNINTPNSKGETPLIQLVKDIESAKAYHCTRFLIGLNVDVNVKDANGATAEDYLSSSNSLKASTLKREINENKNKEVFKGGNTPRITEINQSLKENNDKLYDAYGYKMEINGDESKYSALNFSRSANRYSRLMAGNPRQQDVSRMRKLDDFSENIR
ncbi:MAG: ankyrin repeat domain-containing protein [Alphaproteobacteria bacterium]|nr:ankyrin repeat domain-containing protein [Alphaproteobacteria bacterium]